MDAEITSSLFSPLRENYRRLKKKVAGLIPKSIGNF
jgi:hypothetical protein